MFIILNMTYDNNVYKRISKQNKTSNTMNQLTILPINTITNMNSLINQPTHIPLTLTVPVVHNDAHMTKSNVKKVNLNILSSTPEQQEKNNKQTNRYISITHHHVTG